MSEFAGKEKIYTRQFWMLCLSSFLFFGSFNMLIPQLPAYLTALGAPEYKGLIISLFTLTAMLSRPFSGKIADKVGRVPVILFGAAVCFLCSLVYPILTTVSGFLLLRLIHGFSTGFTPTGESAYLSDIIPSHRRGEAMGYFGTAGSLGMAFGPALGGFLTESFGITTMFYCSSLFGILSAVVVLGIKETLQFRERFSFRLIKMKSGDLFEPLVIIPCLVMVLAAYAYGTVFTLAPDLGILVGMPNTGYLFTFLTASSLLVRLTSGKVSDRYGRAPVLMVAMAIIVAAMLVIGTAQSVFSLCLGVSLYGFAHGATTPTLMAWATDLSDENHKARGIMSVYIFMEFGIGVGALVSGFVYNNKPSLFLFAFAISAMLAAAALVVLIGRNRFAKV